MKMVIAEPETKGFVLAYRSTACLYSETCWRAVWKKGSTACSNDAASWYDERTGRNPWVNIAACLVLAVAVVR